MELFSFDDERQIKSIYFGGCAFGAAFYVGVYRALIESYGMDFLDHVYIGGDSVGAVFCLCLGLKKDPDFVEQLYREVADYSLKHGPVGSASYMLDQQVRALLTDPKAYKYLEGRIFLGTTAYFAKHRWHLSWANNQDLIECIKGSFNIPFYCLTNKLVKGITVLDGAYSFAGIDLPHGDETLFIGIDPHAEITRTFTNNEMVRHITTMHISQIYIHIYSYIMYMLM